MAIAGIADAVVRVLSAGRLELRAASIAVLIAKIVESFASTLEKKLKIRESWSLASLTLSVVVGIVSEI